MANGQRMTLGMPVGMLAPRGAGMHVPGGQDTDQGGGMACSKTSSSVARGRAAWPDSCCGLRGGASKRYRQPSCGGEGGRGGVGGLWAQGGGHLGIHMRAFIHPPLQPPAHPSIPPSRPSHDW